MESLGLRTRSTGTTERRPRVRLTSIYLPTRGRQTQGELILFFLPIFVTFFERCSYSAGVRPGARLDPRRFDPFRLSVLVNVLDKI